MDERLHLFEGYGIEIEHAIVDRATLDVRPWSDRVLAAAAGEIVSDVERGAIAWSNELVAHQIELKTNGPVARLADAAAAFQASVGEMDRLLAAEGARAMPGAMHPWMDPSRETTLWAHEYHDVYRRYDRVFGCRAHGWANVQSVHLNLPFADDAELARLHAAVRAALPLLPALAASSPYVGGARAGPLDARLCHYRAHAARVPELTGDVIPEPVWTRADYERVVLEPIYRALAPHDPDGVLRHEFSNARGAIVRFDRHAVEIRVLDVQECTEMDLAVSAAAAALVRGLVEERWSSLAEQQALATAPLAALLWHVAETAEETVVSERELLACVGRRDGRAVRADELWAGLMEELAWAGDDGRWRDPLGIVLREGPLARRLVRALGPAPERAELARVYRELCDCARDGRAFHASR